MPPLNLNQLFIRGNLRVITLGRTVTEDAKSAKQGPPAGKNWLVLNGSVYHNTGTATSIDVIEGKGPAYVYVYRLNLIAAAVASGTYPLFNNNASSSQSQFALSILNDTMFLCYAGDMAVTQFCRIVVLEW